MAYGVVVDVAAPIQVYDALHSELSKAVGARFDGLLVHVGRETGTGFEVLEIWESKQQYDRFTSEVLGPIMAQLSGGQPPPPTGQTSTEFDVRGLVIPQADVVI